MKRSVCFLIGLFLIIQCEDPIDVETNDATQKLVIEASINWIKETKQPEQEILLSLTTSYFSDEKIPANGAEVYIADKYGTIYPFYEKENSGKYLPNKSIPYQINEEFSLNINYKGQNYSGSESLIAVASIDSIISTPIYFFGEDRLQFEAFSFDPPNEKNYSYFEYASDRLEGNEYNVYRDDFNDGNIYYGILFGSEFEENDFIRFRQYGLSRRAFNYWNLLINQNTQQGGPFQTTPANLNGNMTNLTNSENYPLGYFRVSEVSEILFKVE
ncbi:DUF4249 domain-containing protein [Flavobacteriaceae bacterium]|nr:DUF4249 domain-containing protein [Flavobacteriaceae bacterium]